MSYSKEKMYWVLVVILSLGNEESTENMQLKIYLVEKKIE